MTLCLVNSFFKGFVVGVTPSAAGNTVQCVRGTPKAPPKKPAALLSYPEACPLLKETKVERHRSLHRSQ
jgi:hypothetical protein